MPKCQLLFSAVFGFRNPSKEIFSELDEIKAQGPIFPRSFQKSEGETKRGHEGPHPRAARPPLGRAALWCGAPVPPLDLPFRLLKSLRDETPSTESHDTENLPETPPPPIPSRGIQEIASGTLPERGIISRRTLRRHGRLRCDV